MTSTVDQPATARRMEVGSGAISYFRAGSGRPLLFLHAAGGAGEWNPYHAALAEHFDLIAPDHPGFGRSDDLPELRDVDDLVYHYLDMMDRLGLQQVDLVGASFGGWVAAELAVHSPERFRRLVLLAPVGLRIPEQPVSDLFIMTPPQLIRALYHDPELVESLTSAEPDTEEVLRSYRDLGALARFGWTPFLNDPKLEGRLRRITAPTRVVAAAHDQIVPRQHCERYAAAIPNAELTVVDNCGHALYGELPGAVAATVIDFVAQ